MSNPRAELLALLAGNGTPLSKLSAEHMEEAVSLATELLRADYYADVSGMAHDALSAIKLGNVTNSDDLTQWIDESIDGCSRVIYTWQAKCGLLASDNEDAYDDEMGEASGTPEMRMYWAMRADVREELERLGIQADWDGPESEDEAKGDDNV
jgi:hypothetical protein